MLRRLSDAARALAREVEYRTCVLDEAVALTSKDVSRALAFPSGEVKHAEGETAGFGTGLLVRLDAVRAQGASRRALREQLARP